MKGFSRKTGPGSGKTKIEKQTSPNKWQFATSNQVFDSEHISKDLKFPVREIAVTGHAVAFSYNFTFNFTSDISKGKHRVYWENAVVPYSGVPFMVVNSRVLSCHHGKDKMLERKNKNKQLKQEFLEQVNVNCIYCVDYRFFTPNCWGRTWSVTRIFSWIYTFL